MSTPAELGAIINLDDITHIDFLETDHRRHPGDDQLPLSIRADVFKISNDIMDNPGDAKYGLTDGADVRGLSVF